MVAPTLLENHKYLLDEFGNETSVGSVKEAFAGVVSSDTEDSWVISDLQTGIERNSVLKSRSPKLSMGDRGLFVVAEVTHPITLRKIKKGELGAFSWYGFVQNTSEESGLVRLGMIDLVEISVVNIPAMSQAGFMVGKKLGNKTEFYKQDSKVGVSHFRFPKSKYTTDQVVSFLKSRKVQSLSLLEDENFYFAQLDSVSRYDVAKSFAVPIGDTSVILAPKIEDNEVHAEFIGNISLKEVSKMSEAKAAQSLYLVDEAVLKLHFPKAKIEVQKSMTLEDGTQLEVATLDVDAIGDETLNVETETQPEVEQLAETATEPEAVTSPEVVEAVITQPETVVESEPVKTEVTHAEEKVDVVSILKSEFASLKDALLSLKQSEPAPEKQDEVDSLKNEIAELAKDAEAKQKRLDSIIKGLSNIVPSDSGRQETITRSKSVNDKKSPGDILARLMPF
jgi:hypothetical protein